MSSRQYPPNCLFKADVVSIQRSAAFVQFIISQSGMCLKAVVNLTPG